MADVIPVGPLSVAIDALCTLIANVDFWQAWTGSSNASEALARIFVAEIGTPIKSVAITSNVLTISTTEPHPYSAADVIVLDGASIGAEAIGVAGTHTIVSVPDELSFTIALDADDLATVYPDGATGLPAARPILCVCEEEDPLHSESIGTDGACVFGGSIEILVEDNVSLAYQNNARNALYEARNAYGLLLQGISQLAGTGDFILLNRVESVRGPEFIDTPKQNSNAIQFERWQAVLRVTWGLTG